MGIFANIIRKKATGQATPVLDISIAAGRAAVEALRDAGQDVRPEVAERVIAGTAERLQANPVAVNNLGGERKTESRTLMASIGATLLGLSTAGTSIATLITQASELSGMPLVAFIATTVLGTGTGGAGIFGIIGRLRDDLPPMYNRWWNPLSWLARDREEVLSEPAAETAPPAEA